MFELTRLRYVAYNVLIESYNRDFEPNPTAAGIESLVAICHKVGPLWQQEKEQKEIQPKPAMVVIPTGVGKTAIMMATPFMFKRPPQKVLLVTPNLVIRRNAMQPESLKFLKNFLGLNDRAPRAVQVDGDIADKDLDDFDLFVWNYQGAKYDSLIKFFTPGFFDLLIIDEAHHSASESYDRISSHFSRARRVLVTATPYRGDGKEIDAKIVFKYPIKSAIESSFIKEPVWCPVPITQMEVSNSILRGLEEVERKAMSCEEFQNECETDETCQANVIETATFILINHARRQLSPHCRCIAYVADKTAGELIVSKWTKQYPMLKVKFISGETSQNDRETLFAGLKGDPNTNENNVDVIVNCKVLGEGFDEPNLAVAAIFHRDSSLSPFSQFVGRCVRLIGDRPQQKCFIVSHPGLGAKSLWEAYCKESTSPSVEKAKKLGIPADIRSSNMDLRLLSMTTFTQTCATVRLGRCIQSTTNNHYTFQSKMQRNNQSR